MSASPPHPSIRRAGLQRRRRTRTASHESRDRRLEGFAGDRGAGSLAAGAAGDCARPRM